MVFSLRSVRQAPQPVIIRRYPSHGRRAPATSNAESVYYIYGLDNSAAHTVCRLTAWITTWTIISISQSQAVAPQAPSPCIEAQSSQADGTLITTPLIDCVMDFQVAFGLATNLDNNINKWQTNLAGLQASDIQQQLREVRVFLVYQEGLGDTSKSPSFRFSGVLNLGDQDIANGIDPADYPDRPNNFQQWSPTALPGALSNPTPCGLATSIPLEGHRNGCQTYELDKDQNEKPIQNQKGIALIATLMLVVLGFAVVAILLRLSTQQTKLARLEQGYTAALDAAKGATDLFIFTVQNGSALGSPPTPPFGATFNQSNCLKVKMSTATSGWTGAAWAGCPQANNTTAPSAISPNPADKSGHDPSNVKQLHSQRQNHRQHDDWGCQPSTTPCCNGCYYYTVVARATSPDLSEHADVSFVYRYDQ